MEKVKSKVILMGYTKTINDQGPEAIVAAAGKLCYSKVGASEISEKLTNEDVSKFVSKLSSMGHYSPYEHAYFTFAIEGISRTCSHQIVRHRIASYSQQSQRYVNLNESLQIIIPPEIENDLEAVKIYEDSIMHDFDSYVKLTNHLKNKYVSLGMNERASEKKALEDARFALPNACETKMVMTMNARSLINFFKERLCTRAQWEIREVASQMLDLVLEVSPELFIKAGAPCTFGNCPEGAMSCGEKQKPRERQMVKKL